MNKLTVLLVLCSVGLEAFGLSLRKLLRQRFRTGDSIATQSPTEDLHSLLLSRRTINDFEPTLPEGWEKSVHRAIEAARHAPNHKRTEPWRFHLLGSKSVRRVCELNAELVAAKKGTEAGQKKLERWLAMPGWLVVTQVIDDDDEGNSSFDVPNGLLREDYAACCCAVQNLCLSLHWDGLGTKWTTGPVNFDPRFGDAVGNLPTNEKVVGTIWFGKASKTPSVPQKRLSVDDILCRHD